MTSVGYFIGKKILQIIVDIISALNSASSMLANFSITFFKRRGNLVLHDAAHPQEAAEGCDKYAVWETIMLLHISDFHSF